MNYALMMSRDQIEQRVRELYAAGYRVRDLSALFGLHPLIVARIVELAQAAT